MKRILGILLIIFISHFLFSNNSDLQIDSDSRGLNRLEVVIGPWISAGLVGASLVENMLFSLTPPDEGEYYIERFTTAGAQVPAVLSSPLEGSLLVLLSLSQWGILEISSGIYTAFFKYFIKAHPSHFSMFSTYTAYRENRLRAGADVYLKDWRKDSLIVQAISGIEDLHSFQRTTKWKDYSFLELALETLNPKNIFDPMILPIALGFVVPFINVNNSQYYAFWNQDRAFLGSLEMDPLLAVPLMGLYLLLESIFIAVTEESHFRGFIYEEVGSSIGSGAAKAVDMIYFPAIHIRSNLISPNFNLQKTSLRFVEKAALTLYLDVLYDRGGLPLSTAAHMWLDFTYFFTTWLLISGIPQESLSEGLNIVPSFHFEYSIPL